MGKIGIGKKLAIHGGQPVRSSSFPSWPVFGEAEEQRLTRVLRSGKWGRSEGGEVAQFERRFADYHEAKHGIAVVNGTVALRLALLAAGIEAGDEVIVPPYTFVATASAVVEANAVPVFADIEIETFNIDPKAIEEVVTSRTRAIIPVHFGGLPANLDAILEIAARHNLVVIEDACHAHGAAYKGRRVGALGHLGVFSFQSSKNLNCGEGGIILTNDDALAERCWSLHNCGRRPDRPWYEHYRLAGNSRLSEFQGALLNAQWERFPSQADTRENNGLALAERLAPIPGIDPQTRTADCTRHGYHLFSIRFNPDEWGVLRAAFLEALSAECIPHFPGYPIPLYRQVLFEEREFESYTGARSKTEYGQVHCPACEKICDQQGVWLPQHLLLGDRRDVEDIAAAFEKVFVHRATLPPV